MKMKKLSKLLLTGAAVWACQGLVTANEMAPPPLTSVADVDGDGTVTLVDATLVRAYAGKDKYFSLYDVNADGAVNGKDVAKTMRDFGKASTLLDQEMVTFYKRFEHMQGMTAKEMTTFYYDPVFIPLAGHGVHWLNEPGFKTFAPGGTGNTSKVEGLNMPADGSEIKALFYGSAAVPLFMSVPTEQFFAAVDAGEDWTALIGPSDYPFGNAWKDQRVAAYYRGPDPYFEGIDHPPRYFQGAPTMKEAMMNPDIDMRFVEMWHTHPALCMVIQNGILDPHQHTTFNECQTLPNERPDVIGQAPDGSPVYGNAWVNIWMLHLWMYDLNPNGVFAGTHPDMDPCETPEHVINYGKRVPPFFHMSDNHPEATCDGHDGGH